MKRKILLVLIIFSVLFSINSKAQYYTLTDTAFRNTLVSNGLGSCISGMQLDTTCSGLYSVLSIDFSNTNIQNMDGLKYLYGLENFYCIIQSSITSLPELPPSLKTIDIYGLGLQSLPTLPNTLEVLRAQWNYFNSLPILPNSLKVLDFSNCDLNGSLVLPINLDSLLIENNYFDTIVNLSSNLRYLHAPRNSLSYIPALPNTLEYFNILENQLTSLSSLPASLKYLNCASNNISTIPTLPQNLEYLNCGNINVTSLPQLPPTLKDLTVMGTPITSLPSLPNSLINLNVNYSQLTSLPTLGPNLTMIYANNNQLTSLPPLPSSLRRLYVVNNQLSSITGLPDSMIWLECSFNQITDLDSFPRTCQTIRFDHNLLSSIPKIETIGLLDISNNLITTIPALTPFMALYADSNLINNIESSPDTLSALSITSNPISCLPSFLKVGTFNISNTNIRCLPNAINVQPWQCDVRIDTFPFCQPSSGCPVYWNILGEVLIDADNDCISDSNEIRLNEIPVRLDSSGTTLQICYTNTDGQYSFRSALGTYDVIVDTTVLPFSINCPSGITQTINLTPTDSLVDSVNYKFVCRNYSDLAAHSISPRTTFSPGMTTVVYLNVGSSSSNYGVLCLNDSGTVYALFSGPVSYISPGTAALTPTINGDTLIWSIQDFNTIDPRRDFNIVVSTDTTAQVNDTVCVTLWVNSVNDANNYNDFISDCFLVRTSFDPNEKWVSPLEADTSTHTFTYTILFQNTGNFPAENIYILDTLENDLDPSSFKFISSSHDIVTQILPDNIIRFNFHAINLPDSTSDEANSHGFVKFSVDRKPSTGLGSEISNTAYIFFDYNEPVVTNTASLTINLQVSSNISVKNDDLISIYPNPARSYFTFRKTSTHQVDRISIYTMEGKEIYREISPIENTITIDQLPNGIYTVSFLIDGMKVNKKITILR